VLIKGAPPKPHSPYIPAWDKRSKKTWGCYGGISKRYWEKWHNNFKKHLRKSQMVLEQKLISATKKYQSSKNKDLRSIYSGTYKRKRAEPNAKSNIELEMEKEKTKAKEEWTTGIFKASPVKKGRR
jgi:hypothetical protein